MLKLRRRNALRICFAATLTSVLIASASHAQVPAVKSPVEPRESLQHFLLPPGLKIELVASEPEIVDPVACRFDEDGRLWVVEMRDYPHPPAPGEKPKSRIKVLEDRDGNGHFETMHLFADELLFATGVQPWNGGVIATVSGQVIYLKDTDGDFIADVRDVWFTGFTEENPQLRVNHPRFALDNQVYVASGLRGGSVVSPRQPEMKPIDLRSRDLRFDPRGVSAESIAGNGQFGVTFDDWGNRFLCSNRNPCMHVVFNDRALSRNPLVAIPAVTNDVAASGEKSHVYPLVAAWTTSNLHSGQFTAACGVDIYRGDALPADYYGNVFTCEPTGSLVHREIVATAGGSFQGRSPHEQSEFLASRDSWFRPVNLEGGPDGALYVVDMYRAVIEHPQFMPPELKDRPDLLLGTDRGRIYRIVPDGFERPNFQPELSKVATKHLFKLLDNDGAWWRETVARLLYQRQDKESAPGLVAIWNDSGLTQARVHALWSLRGLGELKPEHVRAAIVDPDPRVREQGVILAVLDNQLDEANARQIVALAGDNDSRVRFQAALAIGALTASAGISETDTDSALAKIALAAADDIWTRRAVLTSVGARPAYVLARVLATLSGSFGDGEQALVQELAANVGARKQVEELASVSAALEKLPKGGAADRARLAAVVGLSQGMRSQGALLGDFIRQQATSQPQLAAQSQAWFQQASEVASNTDAAPAARVAACELLGFAGYEVAGPTLTNLAQTGDPQEVRLRAIASLAGYRAPAITTLLVSQLNSQSPAARGAMLDALLSQTDRINALLDEIAAGRMKPTAIDTARAQRLLKYRDPKIVARVTEVLASALPADRTKALEAYRSCLTMKADPARGREVFKKNCGVCHKIGDVGVDVGPSIGDTRTKTPEQLLTDILMPNRAIDNNFMSYTVVTTDGVTHTGIITAETSNSITLKLQEAKLLPLLRSNIDVLQSNGVSLMPEGLEKNVPPQDMADVIAFLKNWRYLDGSVPLGTSGTGK